MFFFTSFNRRLLKILILIIVPIAPISSYAQDTLFPFYPAIKNNVYFWQHVYSCYTTNQGILHDDKNLSIVYEVITLASKTNPNYRKINRKRIEKAKEKYQKILIRLSKNPNDKSAEEKQTAKLFDSHATAITFRNAAKNIRCQIGQKDRFIEGLKRSGAYMDKISNILKSYDLPHDLVYLPHVESSFSTKAYSKFGAAGIWQFTLGTGRRFLKINYSLDERWDPFVASHAAAQLLKENYEKLNSWPLAITAYNHGAAGMIKAKERYGDYPHILANYRSRTFKFASRNFYAEFLAARNVARSYEQFFGKLKFDSPIQTNNIVLEGYAAIEDIINFFNVDADTIAKLNPAIRPPVFKGSKYFPQGYRLHLPMSNGNISDKTENLLPREYYHQEQKPSHFYAVRRGDTTSKIAQIHKVTLSDLLIANNLTKNTIIYVNQNLRIPLPGEQLIPNASITPVPIVEPLEIPKVQRPILAAILPISFGKQETPPKGSVISSELTAQPSAAAPVNPEIISGDLKIAYVWAEKDKIFGLIKVEVEETLGHFADWLEIKARTLRRLNKLRYGRVVQIGQSLKIPLSQVSKELFEERRFDYHKRLQEDFFSAYKIENLQPYYVDRGENIWIISRQKFNLPIWLIQQCNPAINFHQLRHSQKLMIPVVTRKG
jgi:membrane-bound lytic murein transglycosylase D